MDDEFYIEEKIRCNILFQINPIGILAWIVVGLGRERAGSVGGLRLMEDA